MSKRPPCGGDTVRGGKCKQPLPEGRDSCGQCLGHGGSKAKVDTEAAKSAAMAAATDETVCGQPIPDAQELTQWQTWELGRLRAAVNEFGKAILGLYMDKCAAVDTEAQCAGISERYARLFDDIDAELASRGVTVTDGTSADWRIDHDD